MSTRGPSNSAVILIVTVLLLNCLHDGAFTCAKSRASTRVIPDTILEIDVPRSGYIDQVIPYKMERGNGFFLIASSPNQIHKVDDSHNVESYQMNIAVNSKLYSMGVMERCVGGFVSPQSNILNLVYSNIEQGGHSYIIQFNLKNLTQIVEVIAFGPNSHVIDVHVNEELNILHALVRKDQSLSLFTFDPKGNHLKEQGFPFMSTGRVAFMKDVGLIVGIGNSTTSHLLILDPYSLKIISGKELDSRGIFHFQSLSCSDQYASVVYSKFTTFNTAYMYNPLTKSLEPYGLGLYYPTFQRFTQCEVTRKKDKMLCVNNHIEIVTVTLTETQIDYYPLETAENDLKKSFKQVDDEGQLLLYVPQTYVTDDDSFRIAIFNFDKFE